MDEKARQIWFTANGREAGRDPYFQHLYRIGFDGKGLTLLTPEVANHTVSLSPDGTLLRRHVLHAGHAAGHGAARRGTASVVQTLERADISRLVASGWTRADAGHA